MPTLVTDPEVIRRVREAAGRGGAAQPAPSAATPAGRPVSDPRVIQRVKNRARFNEAAKQKREQILGAGENMPEAPDRIAQAFDVAARGPSEVGGWHSALQGAGDSAALGFGDEIGAAMDLPVSSLFSGNVGKAYDINLARRRQLLEQARTQQPGATLAGEIGGALLAPGLGVGTAAKGAGLGTRLLYGAGTGATQGALYGAGSGETLPERAAGAATGTIVGAGLGAAAPVAVRGAQAVGRGIRDAGSRVIAQPFRGVVNPAKEAQRRIGLAHRADRAVPQERLTPADKVAARAAGQPILNVDRGGTATRALAESAANTSTAGRAALETALEPRAATTGARVTDFVQGLVGGRTSDEARQQLIKAAEATNTPAYRVAFTRPAAQNVWDNELEILAGDPLVQSAIRQAAVTGRHEAAMAGAGPIKSPFKIDPKTGGMTLDPNVKPTLRFWDQVKKNLDRVGTRETRASAKVLREHLDTIVPEYNTARSGAFQFFKADNALEAGDEFVMSTLGNDVAKRELAKMTSAQRRLFEEGFSDRFVREVREKVDRPNLLNQTFLKSPAAKERIEMVLGKQRARELETFLRVEEYMNKAIGTIKGKSTTARQIAELGLAGGTAGAYGSYTGDWKSAGLLLSGALLRAGGQRIDKRVAQHVAEMLASSDPAVRTKGIKLVAKNDRFLDALRHLDTPVAKAAAQQGTAAAREPLKVYLNAGERDRAIGR